HIYLNKANEELLTQKEKEIALLEKIAALQTEKDNEYKSSKQLREMVKQLKHANSAMKEQTEKEIAETKKERKALIQTLDEINSKYRELYNTYMKSKMNDELNEKKEEVLTEISNNNEDKIKTLQEEIEALKKELEERNEEKKATIQ